MLNQIPPFIMTRRLLICVAFTLYITVNFLLLSVNQCSLQFSRHFALLVAITGSLQFTSCQISDIFLKHS